MRYDTLFRSKPRKEGWTGVCFVWANITLHLSSHSCLGRQGFTTYQCYSTCGCIMSKPGSKFNGASASWVAGSACWSALTSAFLQSPFQRLQPDGRAFDIWSFGCNKNIIKVNDFFSFCPYFNTMLKYLSPVIIMQRKQSPFTSVWLLKMNQCFIVSHWIVVDHGCGWFWTLHLCIASSHCSRLCRTLVENKCLNKWKLYRRLWLTSTLTDIFEILVSSVKEELFTFLNLL